MEKSALGRSKKRRTRKCLDELRKRSHGDAGSGAPPDKPSRGDSAGGGGGGGGRAASLAAGDGSRVTRSRLTMKLGMFAKGVRSETITRPQLSEEFRARMDENLYKIIDLANGTPSHTVTSGAYERLVGNLNGIQTNEADRDSDSRIDTNENDLQAEVENGIDSLNESPARSSPPCFTPPDRIINSEYNKLPENIRTGTESDEQVFCVDSSSSRSKATSIDDELYQIFKESMREIPSYIGKHIPDLMKDDTFNKTKEYLQRIYTESCHRESEANILECIKSNTERSKTNKKSILQETMEQSILLNPIEYIKQGYYGQQANEHASRVNEHASTSRRGNNLNHKRNLSQNSFNRRMNQSLHYSIVPTQSGAEDSIAQFSFDCTSPDPRAIALSPSAESSNSSTRISVEDNCIVNLIDDSPEYTFYPRKLNQ